MSQHHPTWLRRRYASVRPSVWSVKNSGDDLEYLTDHPDPPHHQYDKHSMTLMFQMKDFVAADGVAMCNNISGCWYGIHRNCVDVYKRDLRLLQTTRVSCFSISLLHECEYCYNTKNERVV